MPTETEAEYLKRRAIEESALAETATDRAARAIHLELANRYAKKSEESDVG